MATIISEHRINKSKVKESLERIKSSVNDAYKYCEGNYERFNKFTNAICNSAFTDLQKQTLSNLGKPPLECNIMEAYVNRLLGEFMRQQPSFTVQAANSNKKSDPRLEEVLEGYLRALLTDADQNNFQMDVMSNQLRGGWGVMKVYADYQNEYSFQQDFFLESLDPIMCYFDPTAKLIHKGDSEFCGEFYIMTLEEFESKYGTEYTDKMDFSNSVEGITWAYSGNFGAKYVLLAHHYEKKRKKKKIMQLVTGDVVTEEDYEDILESWKQMGRIEQPPGIVGKPRKTDIVQICRYTITEKEVLEYVETKDKYLPLVWADGNSVRLRGNKGEAPKQFTKPYPYHLLGMQQAKSFALSTWVNEVENMAQSKIIAPKESIPAEYSDAYVNPQKALAYIYNSFKDNDPNVRIERPEPFPRVPMPPEVIELFRVADQSSQIILGSYDASLGVNDNQLSGVAIRNGAMQSNAAALPATNGHLQALTQVSRIILDKIPHIHTMERAIPVKGLDGKIKHQKINSDDGVSMRYDRNAYNIRVSAGVNFEIQKYQAFETVVQLMKASPQLANFFGNTPQGIETLLDNVDIRGVDALKDAVSQYMQQSQQQQQQMQQAQMQQSQAPLMIKQAEMQQKAQKDQMDYEVKTRELLIKEQDAETRRLVGLADIGEKADKIELEQAKLEAEDARTQVASVNAVANIADVSHKHAMDILGLHHQNERLNKNLEHELKKIQVKDITNG